MGVVKQISRNGRIEQVALSHHSFLNLQFSKFMEEFRHIQTDIMLDEERQGGF